MRKLITKDDVQLHSFYQLPKIFFSDPNYMPMRTESKFAYAFMLDLLPLSIQNDWVNEKGQVFIKLSRNKMMELLNIKGTQKAAAVMKELVDHNLIVYQRVGNHSCNRIYLYDLAPDSRKAKPKAHTPKEEIPDHEIDSIQERLKKQIHIEDLKQRYDPSLVDEICNNICEMYMSPTTPIGKQDKPMSIVRSNLSKLKMHHIEHVIDQFKEASTTTEIMNPKRYIQTMIYNSVFEANSKIVSHIKYNFGY